MVVESAARSFSDSMQRLKSAQKSSRGAPFYSLVINRPMGRVFAALAHQLRLSPNQVTMISAAFTYTGIVLIAVRPPTWLTAALVFVALVLGYALDAADGQLARLRGGGSLAGEWLDHVIDSGKIATLHLAVLIMAYRHFPVGDWWLFIPLAFAAAYVVHFFGMLLSDLLARTSSSYNPAGTPRTSSRIVSILKLPTDYGILCIVFALLGAPRLFMIVYTAMAVVMVVYTALVLPRWYRRIAPLT